MIISEPHVRKRLVNCFESRWLVAYWNRWALIFLALLLSGCTSLTSAKARNVPNNLLSQNEPPIRWVSSSKTREEAPAEVTDATADLTLDESKMTYRFNDLLRRAVVESTENESRETKTLPARLLADQAHFYSADSLANLGLAFSLGAAIANSEADVSIQRHFQRSVRNATSDDWFEFLRANKEIGNGSVMLPIFGSLWLADELVDGSPEFETAGKWGQRSMRAYIVGVPPLLLTQSLTGGSRPFENPDNSHWRPFHDNNGVSGHAFISAIPFITAAKMTDNPLEKSLWYAGSTLGALSRINDNAHYTSQAGLGWMIAFASVTAVNQTDTGRKGWSLLSQSGFDQSGFALQYRW